MTFNQCQFNLSLLNRILEISTLESDSLRSSIYTLQINLANNVLQLHQWMYGSDSYDAVSSTVQEISDHIINETGAQ